VGQQEHREQGLVCLTRVEGAAAFGAEQGSLAVPRLPTKGNHNTTEQGQSGQGCRDSSPCGPHQATQRRS
jgi:hypothetical protein